MSIVIVAEISNDRLTDPTLETLEEGRELAQFLALPLNLILLGSLPTEIDRLFLSEADEVHHVPLADRFSADLWCAQILDLLPKLSPSVLMTPDSAYSRAWLPRLAVEIGCPPLGNVVRVSLDTGFLVCERLLFQGLQREEVRLPLGSGTILITFKPGARGVGRDTEANPDRPLMRIVEHPPIVPDSDLLRDRTVAEIPADMQVVDIIEAPRIVAGGLGLGEASSVDLLWRLAEQLEATVAGTRAISDRHWIPHERYIGSTGKIVRPELYIALGISGASQHVVGMSESETIIAINIDRTAPIFGLADLGIVGDLHQIVPLLIEAIRDRDRRDSG